LFAQMEQAEIIIEARRRIFERYYQSLLPLKNKGLVRLPFVEKNGSGNGHTFYIIVRSPNERSRLLEYLDKSGINAVFHYVPLHSSPAGMKYGRVSGDMKITDALNNRLLRLPMFYEMKDEDVDRVAKAVSSFYVNLQVKPDNHLI